MRKTLADLLVENRSFVVVYLLFLVAGVLAMLYLAKPDLFLMLNGIRNETGDIFFKYFTHVGDGLFFAAAIVIALFKRFGAAVYLTLTLVASGLVAQALKKLVYSEALRPKGWFGSEEMVKTVLGVKLHSFNSFPSGHATSAFALMFALTLLARNKKWGYLFIIVAVLAGYSRIYLGQHFFDDVFFGSMIGVSCAIIVWLLAQPIFNQKWANKSLLNFKG
jgi:membrane-associated phospholipid phosphatase